MLYFVLFLSLAIPSFLHSMEQGTESDKSLENSAIVANRFQRLFNEISAVDPENTHLPNFQERIRLMRLRPISDKKRNELVERAYNHHVRFVEIYVAATRDPNFEYEQSNKRRRLK